jgi:hypothetical protein
MMVSIHRSVMAAREDRLAGIDQHRSGNVFVKLAQWVWSGIVLLVWYVLSVQKQHPAV